MAQGQQTRRPNSVIDAGSWTISLSDISNSVADGTGSYVVATSTETLYNADLGFSAFAIDSSAVAYLDVYGYFTWNGEPPDNFQVQVKIKVNGAWYTVAFNNDVEGGWIGAQLTTNPATTAAWTEADIEGTGPYPLEAVRIVVCDNIYGSRTMYCGEVYLTVDYTISTIYNEAGTVTAVSTVSNTKDAIDVSDRTGFTAVASSSCADRSDVSDRTGFTAVVSSSCVEIVDLVERKSFTVVSVISATEAFGWYESCLTHIYSAISRSGDYVVLYNQNSATVVAVSSSCTDTIDVLERGIATAVVTTSSWHSFNLQEFFEYLTMLAQSVISRSKEGVDFSDRLTCQFTAPISCVDWLMPGSGTWCGIELY